MILVIAIDNAGTNPQTSQYRTPEVAGGICHHHMCVMTGEYPPQAGDFRDAGVSHLEFGHVDGLGREACSHTGISRHNKDAVPAIRQPACDLREADA